MSLKIFGIGLNKTGTTSLGKYFKAMGKKLLSRPKLLLNFRSIYSIQKLIEENDVFEDWPFPLYYKDLYLLYPNAKFILTLRKDEEEWFNSLRKHSERTGPKPQRKIAYGYFMATEKNKKEHINFYKKHKREVIEFFNKYDRKKLLILKTDSLHKEKKIHDFLEIEFDATNYTPYPHENKSIDK